MMLRGFYFFVLIFILVNCGSPREESSQIKSLGQTDDRILGVNALNLIDDHSFEDKNHLGKKHWQETIDYAAWLNAKFIRVTASYEPGQLDRARGLANRLCSYFSYNKNVKYLVAMSDMTIAGRVENSAYKAVKMWHEGKGLQTDFWIYTKEFMNSVNKRCPEAIYAWETSNEARCDDCINKPEYGFSMQERNMRMKHYEDFLLSYATEVAKLRQPGQLFGLGIIRAGWASAYYLNGVQHGGFDNGRGKINNDFRDETELLAGSPHIGVNWLKVYSHPDIDFITLHFYGLLDASPFRGQGLDISPAILDSLYHFSSDLQMAKVTGKAIMLEEFGSTPHDTGDKNKDKLREVRKESFLQIIKWAASQNIKYLVPWQATFHRWQRTGLSWFDGSCYYDKNASQSQRCQIERALQSY
ncbi:MAG: hypothetical protein KBD78_12095 [Oligoflexales bacterium]|nr:hypothetical protein [Oligoflexales bacterium]